MNYYKFTKSQPSSATTIPPDRAPEEQQAQTDLADPIVRRYYYWKYGLQALMWGLVAGIGKTLTENL